MTRRRLMFSLLATTLVLGITAAPAQAQQGGGGNNRLPIVIDDIALEGVQIVNGVLTATGGTVSGTIAGLPFVAEITEFALQVIPDDPATPGTECSVLHLALGPINLAVLGLHVDTSEICLDITATEGGGLLGDLLCGLAGGSLGGVLPTDAELTGLLGGLVELLNGVLNQPAQPAGAQADESVCTGAVEVLHLVLGPLDLSLLGLNVSLDNCDDGPVQVCVSATPGEGLLGDLLGGLAGGGLPDISVAEITRLGRAVTRALADGVLSQREIRQLTNLINRIG